MRMMRHNRHRSVARLRGMTVALAAWLPCIAGGIYQASACAETSQLVARIDRIRIPSQGFTASLEIRQLARRSQEAQTSVFKVYSRVSDSGTRQKTSTLMVCTAPPKDAGKRILFLGRDCWFCDPKAKRPSRISAGQIWSQPTSFDSGNWRLTDDFTASVVGTETIACGDGKPGTCQVIDFTPKDKSFPGPARMRYWVDESGRYWRVEHFTAGGRLFKTIDNFRFQTVQGSARLAGMRIRTSEDTAEASFSNIVFRTLPAEWFDPSGTSPPTP